MYYKLEASALLDESPVALAVYSYESKDEAEIAYHMTIASAMANENVKSNLSVILEENGAVMLVNYWERSVEPEPEPTPEPES